MNLFFIVRLQGQCLVNTITVTTHGTTDTADYLPLQINVDGKIIMSGNTKLNSTQYDATTAAQFPNAAVAWVNSYNSSNLKCFVTASTHDAAGYIYNVGAARTTNTGNGLDYFVQKLTSSGTIVWTEFFNGTGSSTDVASAVVVDDATGDVFVTGACTNTFPDLIDMVTICYNSSGVQQWSTPYDYSNLIDVPTAIELDGGEVIVGGFSGSSFTNNDLVVIRINATSGTQTDVQRTANTNTGAQDVLSSMVADSQGNVYNVGTTLIGTNYNILVQKLDTGLTVVWSQNFDGFGFDDAGVNIDLDANLNVYVTGYASKSNTNKQMVVLKYDNSGTLKWVKYPNDITNTTSEGYRIKVKNLNEIFAGGNVTTNSNQDLCTIRLDSTGYVNMNKVYNGGATGTDKFMDLVLGSNNHIFVSARSFNGTDDDNIVIEYQYKDFGNFQLDTAGGYKFVDDELIIEFDKKALKMSAINNKKLLFGNLNVFVHDSTCAKITDKLDHDGSLGLEAVELSARKIFLDLTEADSLSMTRSGNYVKVPNYICYLAVKFPSNINLLNANAQLPTVKKDIHTCELNKVYELTNANDPNYLTDQGALHGITNYQNGHINCDSAWIVGNGGQPYVRVGVLDSGIDFNHPDYGGMTTLGYDFINSQNAINVDDGDHGTGVSGIISAVRNNNLGIAGMAGKDAANPASPGVTLVDCKVCDASTCLTTIVAPGLAKAIAGTNVGGYAVNVANMSIRLAYSYYNQFVYAGSSLMIKAMNDANRNGVAVAASKGNLSNIGTFTFPADYSDEITMSVGSTGRNGHHCRYTVNCDNASTTWGNIDFCAPGTDSLVYTLNDSQGYKQESGTSHASPHIAGAAALIMSYRNKSFPHWDNLVHEDCEQMLQRTCTDLAQSATYNESVGYDTVTGWGRINVAKVMKKIDKNYYRFRHISEAVGNTSVVRTTATKATNLTMAWPAFQTIVSGNYSTDIFELTSTINFQLLPSEVIIAYWPLNKECWGIKMDSSYVDLDRPFYSKIISMSNTQAVLKTYYYNYNPNNLSFPDIPANIRQAFTLYTYDSTGTVGLAQRIENKERNFITYPNPSTGEFDVLFNSESHSQLNYTVSNLLGQEVRKGVYTPSEGINKIPLHLGDLTNGVYILNIFDNKKLVYKEKLIKD